MCVSDIGPLYVKKRNLLTSDKLEIATAIAPVFKLGDRTVPNNYRHISVIIKVFERVIRKQIVTFLISNGHLNLPQHGFRGGSSCFSALLNVFDNVMQLLSSGNNTVDMVYLDFEKKHLTRWIMVYSFIKFLVLQENWMPGSITF